MTTNTDTQAHGGGVEASDEQIAVGLKAALDFMTEHGVDALSPFAAYPSPSECIRRVYRAMAAASPAAPAPAAGVELDLERIAKSLASMMIEYVEGGINSNQNWRNGLNEIIHARLRRLASPSPDAKGER